MWMSTNAIYHDSSQLMMAGQVTYLILLTCLSNLPFRCFNIFHDQIAEFTGQYNVMCVRLILLSQKGCVFSTCMYQCLDRSERWSASDWWDWLMECGTAPPPTANVCLDLATESFISIIYMASYFKVGQTASSKPIRDNHCGDCWVINFFQNVCTTRWPTLDWLCCVVTWSASTMCGHILMKKSYLYAGNSVMRLG
jgi:hypothetical protein